MGSRLIEWRIYYGDGRTCDSSQGLIEWVPGLNVQAIVQHDQAGNRHVLSRFDYYWYDQDERQWFGGDLFGLFDFLARKSMVKFGRWIPHERFAEICDLAATDPDFASSAGTHNYPAPR